MTVAFCNWCPTPESPDPQAHPDGGAEHLPPRLAALVADRKEWANIAYELWALTCNSIPFDPKFADQWNAYRDRLRERFHAALGKMYDEVKP